MVMRTRRSARKRAVTLVAGALLSSAGAAEMRATSVEGVVLPAPKRTGSVEVEAALGARRSVREVAAVAALDTDERPLAILPVGRPR